jgi:CYTH domain-containing protein
MDRHPLTSRYAEMELERRFLLAELPSHVLRPIRITDRYIRETNLRLRKMEDLEGSAPLLFKLAQKVRPDPEDPTRVALTNLYITPFEYDLLGVHPADVLVKTHYALHVDERYVIVNAFEGELQGLVLLEADFGSEDEMATFSPPDFVVREVSHDDRFSGGRLASTTRDKLPDLL